MKQHELLKRDALLLNFLQEHRGRENAVTSSVIIKHLDGYGYHISDNSSLRKIIRKAMYEYSAPICHTTNTGYFWATSREDILVAISDIEGRIFALNEHLTHLKKFIVN